MQISLRSYLKQHTVLLIVATTAGLLLGAVTACLGVLTGPLVQVLSNEDKTQIYSLSVLFGDFYSKVFLPYFNSDRIHYQEIVAALPTLLLVIAFARFVLQAIQWYLFEYCGELVSRDLRTHIAERFMHQDLNATTSDPETQKYEQSISSALTNDIKLVREFIAHFYGGLPREIFQMVFLISSLILISPKLFAVFVLGLAPLMVVVSRYGKKLKKRAAVVLQNYAELSEWIQQRLLGLETIKHYRTEESELSKLNMLSLSFIRQQLRAIRVKSKISPLMEGVTLCSIALVFYIALDLVFSMQISGALVINFFATLAFLSQSTSKIARYFNATKEGESALSRLSGLSEFYAQRCQKEDLLIRAHDKADPHQVASTEDIQNAIISCEDIGFAYEKNAWVLRHFSLQFCPGRFYAIYGATGSGKSTLFNLLLGIIKPQEGRITFHSSLFKHDLPFCYTPQKIHLSPGTIGDNISYPKETFDAERAAAALEKVKLTSLITTLPDGLMTPVGYGTKALSGGQEQRIALSRLFYWNLPLALVDEGTSAVDPETEQQIFQHLKSYVQLNQATVIMIAHRPIAANFADDILLLRNGQKPLQGTASALRNTPEFRSLLGELTQ